MAKRAAAKWRESASLIMLNNDKFAQSNTSDLKVLLVSRSQNASFMPSSSVFPGGVWESADESSLWLKYFQSFGLSKENLMVLSRSKGFHKPSRENCLEKEVSLRITAIREAFEEVGVFLCRSKNNLSDIDAFGKFREDFDRVHWQRVVHNDASQFFTLCMKLEVVPDLWRLHQWSSWLTPTTFNKRFQTAFYVVGLEESPNVIIEKNEVTDYGWKSPLDYLKSYLRNEIHLPPPQFYELSRLLNFSNLDKLVMFAKERAVHGTKLILPVQFKCIDGLVSVFPGDELYPQHPESVTVIIETGVTVKQLREKTGKLHRAEYFSENEAILHLNFDPSDGHLAPINVYSTMSSL